MKNEQPLYSADEHELKNVMNYVEYRTLIDELLEKGLVTGAEQKESYRGYTQMNVQRMNRWDKHFTPSDETVEVMQGVKSKRTWLIITEGWCGDSAQILPAVEKIASLNGLIRTRYILRDDNDAMMQQFLTHGTRSIPVVVCLDDERRVLWHWGPRPAGAIELLRITREQGLENAERKEKLHLWYAQNKQSEVQSEFRALILSE